MRYDTKQSALLYFKKWLQTPPPDTTTQNFQLVEDSRSSNGSLEKAPFGSQSILVSGCRKKDHLWGQPSLATGCKKKDPAEHSHAKMFRNRVQEKRSPLGANHVQQSSVEKKTPFGSQLILVSRCEKKNVGMTQHCQNKNLTQNDTYKVQKNVGVNIKISQKMIQTK